MHMHMHMHMAHARRLGGGVHSPERVSCACTRTCTDAVNHLDIAPTVASLVLAFYNTGGQASRQPFGRDPVS